MNHAVEIVHPDEMSLLGLMIGRMIERNLADNKIASKIRGVRGKIGITAGRMTITLEFDRGTVRILGGAHGPFRAAIRGSLGELLKIAVGGSPVLSYLRGKIRMKGNPLLALKVMPLVRSK